MKPSLALLSLLLAAPAVFAQQPAKSHKRKSAGFQVGGLDLIRKAAALNAGEPAPAPGTLLTTDLDGRDLQFLAAAVENGQLQLWLGQQAKEKGEADQVKAIGETLAATQDAENRFVGKLAASKGLPVNPAASAAAQKKLTGQLSGAAVGTKFDKAVIDQIVDTVKQSVASYESALSTKDPEIKAKLEQLLPMEKEKLTLISRMAGSSQAAAKPAFRTGTPTTAPEPPKKATPAPAATPATPKPKPGPPAPPSPTPIRAKATPATAAPASTPAAPAASPAATK